MVQVVFGVKMMQHNSLLNKVLRESNITTLLGLGHKKISKKGARIGQLMAQAITVRKAKSVFATYACVETKTIELQEKKDGKWVKYDAYTTETVLDQTRVELEDQYAMPWWGKVKATKANIRNSLAKSKPRKKCP